MQCLHICYCIIKPKAGWQQHVTPSAVHLLDSHFFTGSNDKAFYFSNICLEILYNHPFQ